MPSNKNPITVIQPGPGRLPSSTVSASALIFPGGGSNSLAALNAHITDPVDAHDGSAIGFDGSGTWADGTTNPASDVETQLDKIVSDLAVGDGAGKIQYDGGGTWADGTTNPADTLGNQIDKIITDLATGDGAGKIQYDGGGAWADGTTNPADTLGNQIDKIITDLSAVTDPAGAKKIGTRAIAHGAISIASGTIDSQLDDLSYASNIDYTSSATWADATAFPSDDVQGSLDQVVNRLADTTALASGARKIGCEQIVNTSFTVPAQELVKTVQDSTRAQYNQYNTGPAWLGGRTNPDTTVQAQLDKVVNDLSDNSVGNDDGASRIGAKAGAGTNLTGVSVRAQLDELDVNWGKLSRSNIWTNAQVVEGQAGDTEPVFATETIPTARKLLWQIKNNNASGPDYYKRIYNDRSFQSLVVTSNALWNGTQWEADYTGAPAIMYRFEDSPGILSIYRKTSTVIPWSTSGWDQSGTYGSQAISLGNSTIVGPASIVCSLTVENGEFQVLNTNNVSGSDTNPPSTQGHLNILKAKNIVKCWGVVLTGPVVFPFVPPYVLNGFNIASVSYSGFDLVVTFASNFADTSYVVAGMARNTTDKIITYHNYAVGSVRISHFDASSGIQTDLSSSAEDITFMIVGEQDS